MKYRIIVCIVAVLLLAFARQIYYPVLAISQWTVWSLLGYDVNVPAYQLAQKIVLEQGDAKRCFNLRYTVPDFQEALLEQNLSCIYDIAEARKDANVCLLMLPRRYTRNCLGSVHEELTMGFGCSYALTSIGCSTDVHVPYKGIERCNQYTHTEVQEWCHAERTATLPGVHECDKISADQPSYREECELLYAFKLKDRKHCAVITDEKRRKLCEVKIDVELQYGNQWREEEEHRPTYILRIGTGSYEY